MSTGQLHYYRMGELDDETGTGVSLGLYRECADGQLAGALTKSDGSTYLGYLAVEITEAEYELWKARIAKPDNITYFAGKFPGIGVVSALVAAKLNASIILARQAAEDKLYAEKLALATKLNISVDDLLFLATLVKG